jgi:hypothetical protein
MAPLYITMLRSLQVYCTLRVERTYVSLVKNSDTVTPKGCGEHPDNMNLEVEIGKLIRFTSCHVSSIRRLFGFPSIWEYQFAPSCFQPCSIPWWVTVLNIQCFIASPL